LDSWRGICALLVVVYHAADQNTIGQSDFVRGSFLFVDFFFVLSGFVMSAAYGDRIRHVRQFRVFMLRRTGRVWPLHAFILLAFLGLELTKLGLASYAGAQFANKPFTATMTPTGFLPSLLLVHAMGVLPELTWNIPSWSIAAEYWVYAVFALLAWAVGPRAPWIGVLVAVSASIVLVSTSTHLMDATYDLGFVRCLYGFFVGVALFRAHTRSRTDTPKFGTIVELVSVAVAYAFVAFAHNTVYAYASPLVFAGVILVFADSNGAVSRLLATRWPLRMGTLSYSIYMTHVFLLGTVSMLGKAVEKFANGHPLNRSAFDLVPSSVGPFGFLFGFIGLVVVVSHFTYTYVEVPGQRVFNRLADRLS
jgi:peptidoglycan/LPS O-acetylase OafA/YrhL